MPGMSGRDLAEELWRKRPDTRVLFMSGYTEEAISRHGVLARGTHLISKPYSADRAHCEGPSGPRFVVVRDVLAPPLDSPWCS